MDVNHKSYCMWEYMSGPNLCLTLQSTSFFFYKMYKINQAWCHPLIKSVLGGAGGLQAKEQQLKSHSETLPEKQNSGPELRQ